MARKRRLHSVTQAPNEEAKQSAKQLRGTLCKGFEDAIENDWQTLEDRLREALALVVHIRAIEDSHKRDAG